MATEGRAALGWGALAGSMPSGWPWGPHQGRLPAHVSSLALLLCVSAWLSPRMLALPLSSGVTRGDSARGWRMGDTPFSSGPCQVLGRCQPRALRAAWGPVCTRLCLLSHRPFSRCGLLGRARVCLNQTRVWLGVVRSQAWPGAGVGMGRGCSGVCLTLSKETGVLLTRKSMVFSGRGSIRQGGTALSLQPLHLLPSSRSASLTLCRSRPVPFREAEDSRGLGVISGRVWVGLGLLPGDHVSPQPFLLKCRDQPP